MGVAVLVLLEGRMQLYDTDTAEIVASDRLQSLFCWKVVCNLDLAKRITKGTHGVAVLVLLEGRMQQ